MPCLRLALDVWASWVWTHEEVILPTLFPNRLECPAKRLVGREVECLKALNDSHTRSASAWAVLVPSLIQIPHSILYLYRWGWYSWRCICKRILVAVCRSFCIHRRNGLNPTAHRSIALYIFRIRTAEVDTWYLHMSTCIIENSHPVPGPAPILFTLS